MGVNTSFHPLNIIICCLIKKHYRPAMKIKNILTNHVLVVEDLQYLELRVTFFPQAVISKDPSKLSYKLIMPEDWTPRRYIGALNHSIMSNPILSLEYVALD
jgi:hypothetical protein